MCGRFTLTTSEAELRALLDGVDWSGTHEPRYNIAPGQEALLVLAGAAGPRLESVLWGFSPAKPVRGDRRNGWVNARAESVARRPAFRNAFRLGRAIVPADGFYEWAADAGGRQPYHVTREDGALLGLAAVREAAPGRGFAILTRPAVREIEALHPRMPVILDRDQWQAWLHPAADARDLDRLMAEGASAALRIRPVSRVVNSGRHDGPECLETAASAPLLEGRGRWAVRRDPEVPRQPPLQRSLFEP